jgi:hypothetical protein
VSVAIAKGIADASARDGFVQAARAYLAQGLGYLAPATAATAATPAQA